ncbi:MAG: FAD-dependent oxidoreductase [Nitrospirota bacterium]
MIIIIGAGLAGLSAAYHLGDSEYLILEKNDEAGGLCRSYSINGFRFDYTGHLLHFRDQETRKFVEDLLKGRLAALKRRSYIYSKGVYTPYPFQVNIHGLPPDVVRECLIGFIHAWSKEKERKVEAKVEVERKENFEDWIYDTFGTGIARHFMVPFNAKLWKVPLEEMTSDWVSWLVPRPTLEEVIDGAVGMGKRDMGYNPTFLYPKMGGIGILPEAFLPYVRNLRLSCSADSIDVKERIILLQDGTIMRFDQIISTIPLPELVGIAKDLPEWLALSARHLRYVSVYDINIGIKRGGISDKHWIYFPEPDFVFYRVGFPMNFSKEMAPPGTSSIYAEVSYLPGESIDEDFLRKRVIDGLISAGILKDNDEILVMDIKDIKYAYAVYDKYRMDNIDKIRDWFENHGIYTSGRYGLWEHSSMEDAIRQGRETAKKIMDKGLGFRG